jgi:cytidylate kinase
MAVVAIGQQLGARGLELGRTLAQRLGCPLVGPGEMAAEAARRFGLDPKMLDLIDARQPRFWERLTLDSTRLYTYFRAVALNFVGDHHVVIVGRVIPCMLPAGISELLRIRAISPLKARVEVVMREERLEVGAAERRVLHHDQEMQAWVAHLMHGLGLNDPAVYDLTVNTAARPLSLLSEALALMVREIAAANDVAARQALADHCLAAQVRAALMAHPKIGHAAITVESSRGQVTLKSSALVPPWDELALTVVRQVGGVDRVELEIQEPPPPVRGE